MLKYSIKPICRPREQKGNLQTVLHPHLQHFCLLQELMMHQLRCCLKFSCDVCCRHLVLQESIALPVGHLLIMCSCSPTPTLATAASQYQKQYACIRTNVPMFHKSVLCSSAPSYTCQCYICMMHTVQKGLLIPNIAENSRFCKASMFVFLK